MSQHVVVDRCTGCGDCLGSCPVDALAAVEGSSLGIVAIDPYRCDDCGRCVARCPAAAIVTKPYWPVCQGRGCPLHSPRLDGVGCAAWQERCRQCGSTLWSWPGTDEGRCPTCDSGLVLRCPKTRFLGLP